MDKDNKEQVCKKKISENQPVFHGCQGHVNKGSIKGIKE